MTEESVKTIKNLLDNITCGDLLLTKSSLEHTGHAAPKHPICLDSSLTVQEGCSALANHKISSAPIYDENEGGFIGMLDFRDLIAYVLEVFHKVPKAQHSFDAEMEVSDIVKRALSDKNGVPVKYISNLSKKNPLIAVQASAPVSEATSMLVKHQIHRVIVIQPSEDGSNKFIGVLSQSTISAFVASKIGRTLSTLNRSQENMTSVVEGSDSRPAWDFGNKSLADLGLVQGNVISIDSQDTVLQALYTMYECHISSVPIVERSDGKSELLGSISMTDIKGIMANRGGWRKLYDNVFKFFTELRSTQGLEEGKGNDRVPSFVVHPTSTLLTVIEKMAATKAHRVWIVEGVDQLVGVVSLTDVLPFFLN